MLVLKFIKEHFSYIIDKIFFIILTGAISWYISQSNYDNNMQKSIYRESYKDLKNQIRNLFYVDEDIYIFCKNDYRENKLTLPKQLESFYFHDINSMYAKRNQAQTDLINTTATMQEEKMLSQKSYGLIKDFTSWNARMDAFSSRSDEFCKLPLKNQKELKEWRINLISNILKYR